MSKVFTTTVKVRFAHVDPAGIVFYPRYLEMLNGGVEDWCAQTLGQDFRELHLRQKIGLPTVKLEVEFVSPSELGDDLIIAISVRALGRSSCTLGVVFSGEGRERLRAQVVLVCMDLAERKAIAWPDHLRGGLEPQIAAV